MKIDEVETYIVGNPWKRWVFVKVHTSNGLYGVSEATLFPQAEAVVATIRESRRFYIGKSPFDTEKIFKEWYRDSYSRNTSATNITAMGAIEIACWDIIGKHFGAPVYNLLGGLCRDRLKAYANGWYTHVRSPEDFAERAKEVVRMGYQALKFDPFGAADMSMESSDLRRAVQIVAAVREAVGDKVDILIEGHGRFTPATAVTIGKMIEQYSPRWFEEPVPPEDVEAMIKVSNKLSIPIASGERALTKYAFAKMLEKRVVDIVQPDIINTGGILETRKISAMAEAYHVSVAPHNAGSPLNTAICAQLDACISNFEIQECFDDFNVSWARNLIVNCPTVRDGSIRVPDRPGLGVDLNLDEISRQSTDKITDFNLYEKQWEDRSM